MTKKDFIIVAAAIEHEVYGWRQVIGQKGEAIEALRSLAKEMCERFAADNPRFDETKFLTACGIQE